MTTDIIACAAALADVLERENRALAALDLAAAVALVADKQRATDAFTAAQRRPRDRSLSDEPVVLRLQDLARENRRLLERAMTVQNRVIRLLTRGVPGALTRAPRYTAAGGLARAQAMPPVSFSARA